MKRFKIILLVVTVLVGVLALYFYTTVMMDEPKIDVMSTATRLEGEGGLYYSGNSWIKKNRYGLYEMYIEGKDYERGYVNGILSKELMKRQEDIFVGKLNEFVPNRLYQNFLRAVIGWMNRDLDKNVDVEYLREIYGVSRSAPDDYDFVGPKYQRMLNYHAAHDIGHSLQNMNLVACTSIGVWGNRSADSSLLIGRNFDFYMGEEFAKDKIVLFVKPDSGYKYMSITWGGFTGVVSGMNEKGLTVTLNSAKTGIPGNAKTPVSIIARKMLQYSSTIDQAYQIAKSYDSFVAESFMIGSKQDGKVALIEKTPENTTLFQVQDQLLTCSNHFQGSEWATDSLNVQNINESPTEARRKRLMELVAPTPSLTYEDLALVLRNRLGPQDQDLGMGNEKALNQFVAHHSVIFNPTKGIVWVSAFPYQLGAYVAYDLNKIFSERQGLRQNIDITETSLTVAADSFLYSKEYEKLLYSKEMTEKIRKILWNGKGEISNGDIEFYIQSNPHYFHTYRMLGDYYHYKKQWKEAFAHYQRALSLDIPRIVERKAIEDRLADCKENL